MDASPRRPYRTYPNSYKTLKIEGQDIPQNMETETGDAARPAATEAPGKYREISAAGVLDAPDVAAALANSF